MTDRKAILNVLKSQRRNIVEIEAKIQPEMAAVVDADTEVHMIEDKVHAVRVKFGKTSSASRHGARYRRRDEAERDLKEKLDNEKKMLAEAQRTCEKVLNPEEAKAALEENFQSELVPLQAQHKKALSVYDEHMTKLKNIGGDAMKGVTAHQLRSKMNQNIDERVKLIDAQIAEQEGKAETEWKQEQLSKPSEEQKERSVEDLFGDVQKSGNWVVCYEKTSSSAQIQRLEHAQNGAGDSTYKNVNAYFCFSETRGQAMYLEQCPRQQGQKIQWRHKFYYKMCPLDKVVEIFKSCGGKDIGELPAIAIDKSLFADVF